MNHFLITSDLVNCLSGSGSDTAEGGYGLRHAFMLSQLYPKLTVVPRDPTRGLDFT